MSETPVAARVLTALALAAWSAGAAAAQPVEVLGARALGLGGAFVAVADDPSAVYWNPAGLVDAGLFGLTVDLQRGDQPRSDDGGLAETAVGYRGYLVAVATPPLGAGYYRISQAGQLVAADGTAAAPSQTPVARLVTDQVVVTLLQSLAPFLTVGGSLKFVHGSAGTGVAESATSPSEVRDAAWGLPGRGSNTFDVDVGVKAAFGAWVLGLVARNLTAPTFSSADGTELALDRQVRLGLAMRPAAGWVLAADADLTTSEGFDRDWRGVAFGAERWFSPRRFAVRGGVRLSSRGSPAPVGSVGASVAVRTRLWLEAHGSLGDPDAAQAWGLALRFAY